VGGHFAQVPFAVAFMKNDAPLKWKLKLTVDVISIFK